MVLIGPVSTTHMKYCILQHGMPKAILIYNHFDATPSAPMQFYSQPRNPYMYKRYVKKCAKSYRSTSCSISVILAARLNRANASSY